MNLSRQEKSFLLTALVSLIVMIVFRLSFADYFFEFLTEFMAVLLGISFVVCIDRFQESDKNKKDKRNLLSKLRNELEQVRDNLTGQGNLHYPELWDSAVSSGQLRLLNMNEATRLATVYRFIKRTEYEAKRVRDLAEDRRRAPEDDDEMRSQLYELHKNYTKNLRTRETELRTMIEELLQDQELWGSQEEIT